MQILLAWYIGDGNILSNGQNLDTTKYNMKQEFILKKFCSDIEGIVNDWVWQRYAERFKRLLDAFFCQSTV